jgi:hypothetical protein
MEKINRMLKKYSWMFFLFCIGNIGYAADIPESIAYTRIYDFLDELANDGIIELVSVVKPYSREFIAEKLEKASLQEEHLNKRQRKELDFFLNNYALERDRLPDTRATLARNDKLTFALIQPAFYYRDDIFRTRIMPILGGNIIVNDKGNVIKRWFGGDFQAMITPYISIYGNLRDISMNGELLSQPQYLNDYPGYQYKESASGGDYSNSKGGISISNSWGSVSFEKENPEWGDNYHGSNIFSGRAPSFPMLKLHLKPVKWFQLDYFHGWLVSNVADSTNYFMEEYREGEFRKHYRMANKFIAANMLTFTPVRNLNLSVGNATIYSEPNAKAAYFIPVAFYKSLDHTLTKGTGTENGNSALFINISSRNIRHLHLYTSIFMDEIKFGRFKSSNKENNPVSFKIGGNLTNFPLQNVSLIAEFTRSNIINYKHSVSAITWASNSYNLGHYLGDNSQEIYVAIRYKPIRGLDLNLSFMDAKHGNDYNYIRRIVATVISQPVLKDITWTNQTLSFKAQYEIFNNVYAGLNIQYSNIRGHDVKSETIPGENRLDAQGYLDKFTPPFLQGKTLTCDMLLTIGF